MKKYNEFYFAYRQKDQCVVSTFYQTQIFIDLYLIFRQVLQKPNSSTLGCEEKKIPEKEMAHFLDLFLSPTYDIYVFISGYVLKHEILNVKKVR